MQLLLKGHRKKFVVISILVLLACGCRMYFKTTKDTFTTHKIPGSVERGKNLIFNIRGGFSQSGHRRNSPVSKIKPGYAQVHAFDP